MSDIVPLSDAPLKCCTKCGVEFPGTAEFFARCKRVRCGLKPQCKTCTRAYAKEYESNPTYKAKRRLYMLAWHEQDRVKPDVQVREKAYRDVYNAKYREVNREHLSAQKKQLYQDPEIRERIRARHKEWCQRPENRERLRTRNHNRHALQKGAEGTFTEQEMRLQYERQKGKCYWCHHPVAWNKHHDDHIIPLNRGGSNWPDNMCIACPTCNMSRRDKLPHEWPEGGRLL